VEIATCSSREGVRQRSAPDRLLDFGGHRVPGHRWPLVELARTGDHACSDVLACPEIRRAEGTMARSPQLNVYRVAFQVTGCAVIDGVGAPARPP